MPHTFILQILEQHYASIKQAHPTEGRRKCVLRTLHSNWPNTPTTIDNAALEFDLEALDRDPYDEFLDIDTAGVLIRTDYSNEEAWQTFWAKFKESERDLLESLRPPSVNEGSTNVDPAQSAKADVKMNDSDGDESDESSDSGIPDSIITVYNPSNVEERAVVAGISNLTALQLFNDVDVRPAIPPPPDTKTQFYPNNVLINKEGWQEIYTGKNLWIYDSRSIQDECVRAVAPSGDLYGTATGDSWRARVSHISELQFNMAYLGMTIDFGGLDRWDPQQRSRNLTEAAPI